jgi:uncharacterized protein (TIGR02117 family)
MKKFLKYTGRTLATFLLTILLYLGFAWLFSRITISAEPDPDPEVSLFLESNGVHIDLILPVKSDEMDWGRAVRYSDTRSRDSAFNWLAIGWGDKDFYLNTPTWADLKFGTAVKAIFGLSPTAIHTTYCSMPRVSDHCFSMSLSHEQYRRLVGFIKDSFRQDSLGNPIAVQTTVRYDDHDAFYEARGSYNAFHTCNTWINNALKASGQKACLWTPFDGGILYQYRRR